MVDRAARDKAAQALQQFTDGLLTSDQFDDAWPRQSDDAALGAVLGAVSGCFEDRRGRRLRDQAPQSAPRELNRDEAALFERCVLFLRSDLEHDPQTPIPDPPLPRRAHYRAGAALVLIAGIVIPVWHWGISPRTLWLPLLWGVLWVWLFHVAERVFCRPPEGWTIGVVFWPFASQADYNREQQRANAAAASPAAESSDRQPPANSQDPRANSQ